MLYEIKELIGDKRCLDCFDDHLLIEGKEEHITTYIISLPKNFIGIQAINIKYIFGTKTTIDDRILMTDFTDKEQLSKILEEKEKLADKQIRNICLREAELKRQLTLF